MCCYLCRCCVCALFVTEIVWFLLAGVAVFLRVKSRTVDMLWVTTGMAKHLPYQLTLTDTHTHVKSHQSKSSNWCGEPPPAQTSKRGINQCFHTVNIISYFIPGVMPSVHAPNYENIEDAQSN